MKLIDKDGRIYVPPKRGRLPRKYRWDDDKQPVNDWTLMLWLLVGATFWGGIWWWLT